MRVAICDDMDSLCIYFTTLLNNIEDVEVVGTAHNGDECIEMVKERNPEVLMLDIQMRTNDEGLTIIEELLVINPNLKIVILSAHEVEEYIFRAIALGAKDYICKTSTEDEIVQKLRAVYEDRVALSYEVSQIIAKQAKYVFDRQKSILYTLNEITKLSASELSVLRGVYYGKTYKEIAHERYVEEGTVRAQASGILKKLGAKSMQKLVKSIKEMKLFEFLDMNFNK